MKSRHYAITAMFIISAFLSACGPSQDDLDATATQHYGPYYATLTAMAPTPTEVPTSIPTRPPKPSATPEPSATATREVIPGINEPLDIDGKNLILVEVQTQEQLDLMDKAEGGQWVQLEGVYVFKKADQVEIPDDKDRVIELDDLSQTMLVIDGIVEGSGINPMDSELNDQLFKGELVCDNQTHAIMVLAGRFADGKYLASVFVYFIPKTTLVEDCIFIPVPGKEIALRAFFE